MLQEDDQQSEDEQPAAAVQGEIPASPRSDSDGGEREREHYLPRRERRGPKIFTYDQLGTPACYSAVNAAESLYQYQPILYSNVRPMWTSPCQVY